MSTGPLPSIRVSRPRNLACVYLDGRRIYLGAHGSRESIARYHEVVSRWLASRPAISPFPQNSAPRPVRPGTVADLSLMYARHCRTYYVKRGRPTSEAANAQRVLDLLKASGLDTITATGEGGVGPLWLRRFQRWLAGDPESRWSRPTINEYTRIVQRMFAWAAGEEIIPAALSQSVAACAGLRKGRVPAPGLAPPREARRVRSAPRAWVVLARRRMPRPVRVMVDLQLLTGARSSELCGMRIGDITTTRNPLVWEYTCGPNVNKTEHHEHRDPRTIYFGPRAQRLLAPFLAGRSHQPGDHVFCPRRWMEEHNAARRAARASPRWPSHGAHARKLRAGAGPDRRGERYSPDSYRRAIARACAAAGVPHWFPHQLRHTRATEIANLESLTVAKELLGHADIATTMRYVDPARRQAIAVAARRA